jgi:hypothetical protein
MSEPHDPTDSSIFLGKLVLVGITRVSTAGEAISHLQYHGRISGVSAEGIQIETAAGKTMTLPPALDSLQPAAPGEYRERSSGDVVVNPDFISTWQIRESSAGEDPKWSFTRIKFPARHDRGDQ